jgi:glycosyltransferase involved in cell wall biosynthesis
VSSPPRPRIAYVTSSNFPDARANTYQSLKVCEAFAAQGCATTLLYPLRGHSVKTRAELPRFWDDVGMPSPPFALRPIPTADLEWVRLLGLGRLYEYVDRAAPPVRRLWYRATYGSFALGLAAYLLANRRRFDLVYMRSESALFAVARIRRWLARPLVFELHGLGPRRRIAGLLGRATKVVTLTEQMRQRVVATGVAADRIFVAPDAVDLARFDPPVDQAVCRARLGLPLDRPVIGYVGRFQTMGMDKGIPTLIRALSLLGGSAPARRPLLLCVGGPLDRLGDYAAIARERGLSPDDLRFVDRVPPVEVPYWIKACDAATIPFDWTEHFAYYASPLKMFEYMAARVPVVASDLPALREVLRHRENALLVRPDDPADLARALTALLEDPDLAARLAGQARRDVAPHTWDARALRILDELGGGR